MQRIQNFKILFLAILVVLLYTQCKSKLDQWPALDEFHTVMSETFHPSEDGNLEPIKSRSGEMSAKAEVLANSSIPVKFDNAEVKQAVQKLKEDSKKLDESIQAKATDEAIKKALSDLHDTFHLIMEKM